jgi:hypothetical protein
MRDHFGRVTALVTAIPLAVWAVVEFVSSVDWNRLNATLLTLSQTQTLDLLVLTVALFVLHEVFDSNAVREALERRIKPAHMSRVSGLSRAVRISTAIGLGVFVFITLLDLVGGFPEVDQDLASLAPKLAVVLLSSVYIYLTVERPALVDRQIDEVLSETGATAVLTRQQDHEFMDAMLDELPDGSSILVTHFEEPRNSMHADGYYYESDFMAKWWRVVEEKRLRITQIVLVNSIEDISALERRIELTRDLDLYAISCLVAPKLTVFMDMMVVPDRFTLVAFSDDPAARNMGQFSLLIKTGPAIAHFEHLFMSILKPEAIAIKTFEGVNEAALDEVKRQVEAIDETSSQTLKQIYEFQPLTIANRKD